MLDLPFLIAEFTKYLSKKPIIMSINLTFICNTKIVQRAPKANQHILRVYSLVKIESKIPVATNWSIKEA